MIIQTVTDFIIFCLMFTERFEGDSDSIWDTWKHGVSKLNNSVKKIKTLSF